MAATTELGPLAHLLGTWEGEKGTDLAPAVGTDDDSTLATSLYRERMVFEPTGQVDNHSQTLFGLRYSTTAWRIGDPDPFHEEVGYWMWDAESKLIIRTFMPPRGMAVLAGGYAEPAAKEFSLEAESGSEVFGICSSPFLTEEFKTVRFTLDVQAIDENTFSYDQHTWLKIKGTEELFDHEDSNTMHRVVS